MDADCKPLTRLGFAIVVVGPIESCLGSAMVARLRGLSIPQAQRREPSLWFYRLAQILRQLSRTASAYLVRFATGEREPQAPCAASREFGA